MIDTKLNTVVETVGIGLGGPYEIAMNASGSQIFAGADTDMTLSTIDTATRATAALFPSLSEIRGMALDATNIYLTRFTFSVVEVAAQSGSTIMNFTGSMESGASGIAIDATNAYWTDYNSGFIRTQPLSGGGALTLTSSESHPRSIAVTADYVYWTQNNADGALRMISKGGGTPLLLAQTLYTPTGVAADDDFVVRWGLHFP